MADDHTAEPGSLHCYPELPSLACWVFCIIKLYIVTQTADVRRRDRFSQQDICLIPQIAPLSEALSVSGLKSGKHHLGTPERNEKPAVTPNRQAAHPAETKQHGIDQQSPALRCIYCMNPFQRSH